MIADALLGYAAKPNGPLHPRTVAALDLRTLEKLPAEWVRPDFRLRLGDQVWRVRFRWARDWSDPGGYYLLLDFHRHREDYPRADNAMSLLIGLESAATPDGLLPPLRFLRGLRERRLAGRCWIGRCGGWAWKARRQRR